MNLDYIDGMIQKCVPTRIRRISDAFSNEHGISITKQAHAMGLTPNMLSGYRSGKSVPSAYSIARMSRYYDVSTDYILYLTDEPRRCE